MRFTEITTCSDWLRVLAIRRRPGANGFCAQRGRGHFLRVHSSSRALRIHRAGYRVRYLTEAQAFHKGGGTSDQVKAKRMFYSTRSRILYGFKHFGFIRAVLMAFGIMCLEPITRLIYYVLKRRPTDLRESMAGYALFWRTLPGVFRPGWTRRA